MQISRGGVGSLAGEDALLAGFFLSNLGFLSRRRGRRREAAGSPVQLLIIEIPPCPNLCTRISNPFLDFFRIPLPCLTNNPIKCFLFFIVDQLSVIAAKHMFDTASLEEDARCVFPFFRWEFHTFLTSLVCILLFSHPFSHLPEVPRVR